MSSNRLCEMCQSQGLAIMPLRYAVLPDYINPTDYRLPDWAKNNKLEQLKLSSRSRYGMRVMRKGYLYMLVQRKGMGGWPGWQSYVIDDLGRFWQRGENKPLTLPTSPDYQDACFSLKGGPGHVNTSFICITEPQTCTDAWIAFSDHKWNKETLELYFTDSEARNKRMRHIKPERWINGYTYSEEGVAPLSSESLSGVVERHSEKMMQSGFLGEGERRGTLDLTDSTEEEPFKLRGNNFFRRYSKTDVSPRGAQIRLDEVWEKNLLEASQRRSTPNSPKPMMIALWDSIGIVDELTGWLEQLGNNLEVVKIERQWEIETGNALVTLQEQINASTLSKLNEQSDRLRAMSNNFILSSGDDNDTDYSELSALSNKAKRVLVLPPTSYGLEGLQQEVARYIQEVETDEGLHYFLIVKDGQVTTLNNIFALKSILDSNYPKLRSMFEEARKVWYQQRSRFLAAKQERLVNGQLQEWAKYTRLLNQNRVDSFKQHYEAFLEATINYQDALTQDLLTWLNKDKFPLHPFEIQWPDLKRDNPRLRLNISEAALQVLGCSNQGHEFFEKELENIKPDRGFHLILDCVCVKGLSTEQLRELKGLEKDKEATEEFVANLGKGVLNIELASNENLLVIDAEGNTTVKPKLTLSGSHIAIIHYLKVFKYHSESQFFMALQWLVARGGGVTKETLIPMMTNQLKGAVIHRRAIADSVMNNKPPERYFTAIKPESEKLVQSYERLTPEKIKNRTANIAGVLIFVELFSLISLWKDDRVKSLEEGSLERLQIMASLSALALFSIKAGNTWIEERLVKIVSDQQKDLGRISNAILERELVQKHLQNVRIFGHCLGAMSAAIGVVVIGSKLDKQDHEAILFSRSFNMLAGTLSTADFVSQVAVKQGLVTLIAERAEIAAASNKIARALFLRGFGKLAALALSWQVSLVLFTVEIVLSFIIKTPLEKWFLFCRFGKEYLDDNAYKTPKEQFEAVDHMINVEKWKGIDQQKHEEIRKLFDHEELKKYGSLTD